MKTIDTKRFFLRKLEKKDLNDVFEILSNPRVIKNLNMSIHKSIEDTEKLFNEYFDELEKGTKYPYAIIDKKSEDFIGVFLIKLDLYDDDCFEFTIYLKEKYWGQGIYSEILPYMIDVAFEDIKTGNFRGFVKERNIASCKVLEKTGFIKEKIFKVSNLEGKIISYLITKEDYDRKKLKKIKKRFRKNRKNQKKNLEKIEKNRKRFRKD